ncbi:MAG TPA: lipopolysaccharide heptosyltransferase I [Methylibium sp.]|uniref:lipopolysaccharide heptosyltransferase I n=1 Tax=Methylibium sp. TaxID=2067992 RepID=UPI002DBF1830|nr:lipopolysaccharide heptosyltransferase I [Methylibium sp.]HEU4459339.1 lipopolysaccharide heptosyltransferase I [Methylibium sp.]
MRVLIVRLSSLGDIVHAAAVLPDIAHAHPAARIDWVVEEAFVPLARCMQGIERIVPIALRRWRGDVLGSRDEIGAFWRELRRESYDAVIDLQGLAKSAAVARAARIEPGGFRYGLANRTDGSAYEPVARWAYGQAVRMPARIHVVDRSRQLVASALGHAVEAPPRVPWRAGEVAADDALWADPRAVLLVHGSAKPVKLIGARFWVELGQTLARRGAKVWLPWGNEVERDRADAIAAGIGEHAAVLPRLALDRLAAVLTRLHGAIGLDTGLTHMAATLGRPTVQLFVEDKAWRAAAYWEPKTAVLQQSEAAPPTVAQAIEAWERVA